MNFIYLLGNRLWRICEYKLLNILLLASLFIFAFLFPIYKVSVSDIWHNLKVGEIIWQNKEIPKKDIFSCTAEGKEWVNPEWLYQMVVYSLYSSGNAVFKHHPQKSFAFLIVFQGVLLSIISFFIISSLLQRGISISIAVFSAFFVLLASESRLIFRSEIYSLFFIVLYLWIFDRFKQGDCPNFSTTVQKNLKNGTVPINGGELLPLNPFAPLRINSVKGANIIFLLPVLQWLWLSMHGGFVMGFLLIALFLISELIAKAVYSQKPGVRSQESRVRCSVFEIRNSKLETQIPHSAFRIPKLTYSFAKFLSLLRNLQFAIRNYIAPPISNSQLKKLSLSFFLTLLLPLLNPFSYKVYLLPFQVQLGEAFKIMRAHCTEWMSINAPPAGNVLVYFYIPIVILSLTGLVLQKEKRNIFYYLLFFFVLPMPYAYVRHIGVFAVSSIFPIALGIQSISQRLEPLFEKSWQKKTAVFLLSGIVFLFLIWSLQTRVRLPAYGIGVYEGQWLPGKACKFLEHTGIKGPMFNFLDWGGYFLWRFYPKHKTFADSRNVMLKNELMEKYQTVAKAKSKWEEVLSQYNVHFIIITRVSFEALLSALDASPNWCLIYFDDLSFIYLRKTETNRWFIEKYGYRWVKLLDHNLSYIKDSISLNTAIAEFKRKIKEDPSCVIAHTFLALLLEKKGEIAKAEIEYRLACEYAKDDADALLNLAAFYLRYGGVDFALASALQAYKKAFNLANVHFVLGECYLTKNDVKKAKSHFNKALKSSLDKALIFTEIGLCHLREKKLKDAEWQFKSALHINPSYVPAHLALAKCYKEQMNLDAVESELKECLKISPNSAECFYNLASLKVLQGNQKEAIKLLKEAIKLGGREFAKQAVKDPDFVSMQENKEFRLLIEQR